MRRLDNPSGQPMPVLHHPHRKEVLSDVQKESLFFSLCPLPPILSVGNAGKSLEPFIVILIVTINDRMRGNAFKLKEGTFRLDIRGKFFTEW